MHYFCDIFGPQCEIIPAWKEVNPMKLRSELENNLFKFIDLLKI